MFTALAELIDRRAGRSLIVALAVAAIAAPLGVHVRDHLKLRGFDVAGSDSAGAGVFVAEASGADPANTVLALIRLPAPFGAPSARRLISRVERKLSHDLAVVVVLDASSAHNP